MGFTCPPNGDCWAGDCGGGSDVIERDCFIVMAHCEFPTPVNNLFSEAVDEDAGNSIFLGVIPTAPPSSGVPLDVEVVALGGSTTVNGRCLSSFITGILVSRFYFFFSLDSLLDRVSRLVYVFSPCVFSECKQQ